MVGIHLQRADHHRRDRASRRRARDPPRGDRGRALRRGAAPARALPARAVRALGGGAGGVRPGAGSARRRRVLEVLHGRGVLGAGAATPRVPGGGLGRGRGPNRRLPRHLARRGRGSLAADPRSLGRLRPGRDGPVPRPRATAAERRRARLRARAGRHVRHAGPLARPALRPLGRGRARQLRAARRLVRRGRRGPHRVVAHRQADARLADLRAPLAERATCIAGLAVDEQSDAEDAAGAARPERVEGAWFVDGTTRMDDQQHALAGLLRTIPIAQAGGSASSGEDTPSGWLWAAALLLALNPARAAFGVPRAGRSPRAVAGLAALGGAVARSRCAPPRSWATRCSTRSTSATPRSASPPGSWPRWPAPSTCSGDRPRPNRRSTAGGAALVPVAIPRSPARPCWSWRSARARHRPRSWRWARWRWASGCSRPWPRRACRGPPGAGAPLGRPAAGRRAGRLRGPARARRDSGRLRPARLDLRRPGQAGEGDDGQRPHREPTGPGSGAFVLPRGSPGPTTQDCSNSPSTAADPSLIRPGPAAGARARAGGAMPRTPASPLSAARCPAASRPRGRAG